MPSLRLRLTGLFVLVSVAVAGVMIIAVQRFSAEQVMHLAMQGGSTPEEAQAMFDQAVGNVLFIGAGVGLVLGMVAAWWLVRRVLHPLEELAAATRAVGGGDLAARVADPPDPELRPLADSFNQMAASLERAEALRRSLVEDVSHELRTPLTSLQGYLEAMTDGIVEPTPEMLRTVHEEIMRLARLVEGLDQLARGQQREPVPARVDVDLADAVQRAAQIAAPELAGRGIDLAVEAEPGPWRVRGDPDGIGQVLANLMQNASRYTNDAGQVRIRLVRDGRWLRCSVANSGPDIPAAELPNIWERLHRADPSRARATGGSGIGLAVVRQIVEAHGGEVGARSGGGWTEVWFRLPMAASAG